MLLKKKWSYSKELNNLKNFISCNHHHISVLSCIMCMLFCNIFMNYPTEWYLEIEVNIRLYYKISYWAYCYFYFPWWLKCLWTSGSNLEIHLHEKNITLNMNCNIYNQCRREIESQTCKGQKNLIFPLCSSIKTFQWEWLLHAIVINIMMILWRHIT